MTIMALLNHPQTPVLLSDMLLSTEGAGSKIFIPTLGNLQLLQEKYALQLPYTATRMVRKPFMVGEKSIVAWAGMLSSGEALRIYLNKHCIDGIVTQENIDSAFWELFGGSNSDFSVVCVSIPSGLSSNNWRENVLISHRGCITFESKLYGQCFLGGSGAYHLKNYLESREALHAKVHGELIKSDTQGLLSASLCGHLIFRESLLFDDEGKGVGAKPSELLLEACGGFFETYGFGYEEVFSPKSTLYIHIQVGKEDAGHLFTRIYYFSSRNNNGMVFSLLSNPKELTSNELIQLDNIVDAVMCMPFEKSKEHMYFRGAASEVLDGAPMPVDRVSVIFFDTSAKLPDEYVRQLDDIERIEAQFARKLSNQQFVDLNDPRNPIVEISADEQKRMMLRIDSEWMSQLLQRFMMASKRTDFFVE